MVTKMICPGRPLKAAEALERGVASRLAADHPALIAAAMAEIDRLQGDFPRISEGKIQIPPIEVPDSPRS